MLLVTVTVCAALVVPTVSVPKLRVEGVSATGFWPVPAKLTVCGLLLALSVIVTVAVEVPAHLLDQEDEGRRPDVDAARKLQVGDRTVGYGRTEDHRLVLGGELEHSAPHDLLDLEIVLPERDQTVIA